MSSDLHPALRLLVDEDEASIARIHARLVLAHPEIAAPDALGELGADEAWCALCGRVVFTLDDGTLTPHDRGTLPVEICDGMGHTAVEALAMSRGRALATWPADNDGDGRDGEGDER